MKQRVVLRLARPAFARPTFVRLVALVAAACFAGALAGRADAGVVSPARLAAALASAKNVQRKPSPDPNETEPYYVVAGTDAQGFVNADTDDYGYLANGADVLIVPLQSGGSGGVFYTLLFTTIATKPAFIGYIPSGAGHLDVYIDGGRLIVETPIYKGNDPNCCPSGHHVVTYTLDGTKLKKLSEYDRS